MEEDRRIAITVIYVVLFFAAILGNAFVIYVVFKKPGMKSPTNLLLVNMAIADLLFAVFMYPLVLIRFYVRGLWIGGVFGKFTCHTMFFMSHLPIAGSTTTLIFIAFERFFAIIFPYKIIKIFRKVWIITAIIWLSSTVLMVPVGIVAVTKEANNQTHCNRDWSLLGDPLMAKRTFYNVTLVAMYVVPLLVMAVLYSVICHKLWRHRLPGHVTRHAQQNSILHKRQVVRMLVAVVIVFALCWLPTHVQHFMIDYFPEIHARLSLAAMVAMNLIGHINPAINPCLLVGLNNRYRREFLKFSSRRRVAPSATLPTPAENLMPKLAAPETRATSSTAIAASRSGTDCCK